MRFALAIAVAASLFGCKKHPQPTVSRMSDTDMMGHGGDDVEYPEGKLFHVIYRYSGHASAVLAHYGPEMDRRGAARFAGDIYSDGNVEHLGDIGRSGTARVKDPTKPGVWFAVFETNDFTMIDIWEAVPNPA